MRRFLVLSFSLSLFATALTAFAGDVGAASASGVDAPFWRGKPKIEARLRDERAVIVSVKTEKGRVDKEADFFSINGVGWVRRDAATVFALAQQFERLKEVSDHFREVKFDPKTQRVFVICQALGYQARMLFSVEVVNSDVPVAGGRDARREIRFKVLEGHFVGLAGTMEFAELKESSPQTEVSLRVQHEAREIPIPRILVGFALEILIQKVALKMRTHLEESALVPNSPLLVPTPPRRF